MILEDLEKPVPIKMAVSKRLCSSLLCQQQTRSFKYSRSDSQKSLWKTKRLKSGAESPGGLVHYCKKGEFYGPWNESKFFSWERPGGRDGRVGRPLLISPHRHTKMTTIYRATIYEKDLRTSRKDSPQINTQRRNHNKIGAGAETPYSQDPHSQVGHPPGTWFWEDNHNCRHALQGARALSLVLGSPTWGSCTGKTRTQNVWLWKALALAYGRARGLQETEAPIFISKITIIIQYTKYKTPY